MTEIQRFGPSPYSPTRGRTVVYNGVATASTKSPSLYEQAREALGAVDRNLAEAGTDKSRVLTVMAYVADIRGKPEFNRAWDEWVDRKNQPMRACLGVDLECDDLVELVVTAAVG